MLNVVTHDPVEYTISSSGAQVMFHITHQDECIAEDFVASNGIGVHNLFNTDISLNSRSTQVTGIFLKGKQNEDRHVTRHLASVKDANTAVAEMSAALDKFNAYQHALNNSVRLPASMNGFQRVLWDADDFPDPAEREVVFGSLLDQFAKFALDPYMVCVHIDGKACRAGMTETSVGSTLKDAVLNLLPTGEGGSHIKFCIIGKHFAAKAAVGNVPHIIYIAALPNDVTVKNELPMYKRVTPAQTMNILNAAESILPMILPNIDF